MTVFFLRRALRALLALWGVSTIVFVVMRLSGDPVPLLLPPDAPASEIARVRADLGLDQPLWVQYLAFFGNLAHGDLGRSIQMRQPAMAIASERLPATFELAIASFALAVAIAIPAGLISALKRNSFWDQLAMG